MWYYIYIYIYIYNIHTTEYHSAIKKKKKSERMPFAATHVDLEMTILSEASWTEKD